MWDALSGRKRSRSEGTAKRVSAVALSPDSGSANSAAKVGMRHAATGDALQSCGRIGRAALREEFRVHFHRKSQFATGLKTTSSRKSSDFRTDDARV